MSKKIKINDISKDTNMLSSVPNEDLMELPWDVEEKEWEPIADSIKETNVCILDDLTF